MSPFDLDNILLELPDRPFPANAFRIRDAVEGVQIFGGIGSGKTSGSGRMLALKYLQHDFGGLVLTVKPDEKEMWVEYCRQAMRFKDLIIIEPGGRHHFNFLEYESSNQHGLSLTENIVQVIKTVMNASEDKSGSKSNDTFWDTATDMLMFNVVDLCLLAYGKVTVQLLYDIIMTAPKKQQSGGKQDTEKGDENKSGSNDTKAFDKAYRSARNRVMPLFHAWREQHTEKELKEWALQGIYDQKLFEDVPQMKQMSFVDNFFIDIYGNLHDRTRSIIEFSFAGFLFRLLQEPFSSLFCSHRSTLTPEDCLDGKIILLNLPVKLYHKVGRDSQILFKYIWQRAMEKRQVRDDSRPVFLWADEAQNFLHEHDADYQATARSSRIATVYISQNLPNYMANMGGGHPEYKVQSFLGTLATKVFHANADYQTNMYAANLIGEDYKKEVSRSSTVSGQMSISKGESWKLEKMARPEAFVSLKTGGPLNNFKTEAIIHKQGNAFTSGENFLVTQFNQKFNLQYLKT